MVTCHFSGAKAAEKASNEAERNEMITEQNIVRHELIGLDVEIVESKDCGLEKIAGAIIDETKKMLKIRTKTGEKLVEKSICTFRISLPSGKKVEIDGNLLAGRPEERIKKKLPKKWDLMPEH